MQPSNKERGRIGRTFVKTYCDCRMLNEHNEIVEMEFVLDGYYNDKIKAQNAIARICGNASIMVVNVTHTKFYASMSQEDFLKHADVVSDEISLID